MKGITFILQRFSSTITGTSWGDSISSTSDDAIIYGYAGNDTIKNTGNRVKIDGGDGADNIESGYYTNSTNYGGQFVTIIGGNGNDYVWNHSGGNKTLIDTGDGNDTITDDGASTTVLAGAGNDRINLRSNPKTVDGGAGNDTINDSYGGGSINGGAGNDIISISGGTLVSTVVGGADNDTVHLHGSKGAVYQYKTGDGYDIIYGYDSADTISIVGSTYYSTLKSGSDYVVSVIGSGSMTLKNVSTAKIVGGIYTVTTSGGLTFANSKANTVITGTSYADSITNSGNYVTISGGDSDDTVENDRANNVSINGGAGNDSLLTYNGSNVTIAGDAGRDYIVANINGNYTVPNRNVIDCGADDDTVWGFMVNSSIYGGGGNDRISNLKNAYFNGNLLLDTAGSSVYLDGGDGNDFIENYGKSVTITGGKGNDTIQNSSDNGTLYRYNSGDNNDIIIGIKASDTLQIAGTSYSTAKSGSDLIVTAGSGKITVDNGANVAFTIHGTIQKQYRRNRHFLRRQHNKFWKLRHD